MARKKDEGGVGTGSRLTPVDVQQVQFKRALRGYDEQEVDDFLDRITEELTLLVDERRAATERAGSLPTVRVASAGDAAAASKQAEELVAQARQRADAIVAEANQRAAAIVRDAEARAAVAGAAAGGAAGSSAAVAAFVAKERDFLQRLASLVQGHAEGVKTMVASAREQGAGSAAAAPQGAGSPEAASSGAAGAGGVAGAAAAGAVAGQGSSAPSGGSAPDGGAPPSGSSEPGTAGPGAAGSSAGAASIGTAAGATSQERPSAVATSTLVSEPREATQPSTETVPPATGAVAAPRVIDLSDSASDRSTPAPASPSDRPAPSAVAGDTQPEGDDSSLRELFWGEE